MASVRVRITRLLADTAGTGRTITVDANTAAEALDALCAQVPELQVHVFDDTGAVRRHVNIFVRGEMVKGPGSLDVEVGDGDEVAVVQAVSGGANHQHDHGHRGHENDQGIKGALRYLRWLPQMWRSPINDAVIGLVGPQPGERVVDIGAGMGAGTMRAATTGAHVLAVEPTPFIRRALRVRRVFSSLRSSVEVVDGAAERIPAGDRTIDAIWAVNTMHHWVDVERGVAEIARVLRPGGRVLLVDEVFTDPSHPDYERFGSDHGPEHHGFTLVEADAMGALLRASGLADVDASNHPIAGRPAIRVTAHGAPTTIG